MVYNKICLNTLTLAILIMLTLTFAKDYYELLDVPKDADKKTIRQAYKKLAITLHPDKNKDDPGAHENFLLITAAYETLKDDELRKKYDLYGEAEPSKQQSYHSWNYYEENFGIYDNDPEIVTFDTIDFEQSVTNSHTEWFVNFYSPMCSHCHDMAPEWRKLARKVDGAIRMGAVNCADEWRLCNQQNVRSYPTLILYPSKRNYHGNHRFEEMFDFVLEHISAKVIEINSDIWMKINESHETIDHKSWVIFLCKNKSYCRDSANHMLLAAMLEGLISVGVIQCQSHEELCSSFQSTTDVIFWQPPVENTVDNVQSIKSIEPIDIAKEVLSLLPDIMLLDEDIFENMKMQLRGGSSTAWLVYFFLGNFNDGDFELKKLPALLPNINIGKVNCARMASVCGELDINRYPLFAVFKQGGGHEIHHGRELAHDVATFARESSVAVNVRVLTSHEFHTVVNEGKEEVWFIDFYAPWCPPCLRLLPAFRKASQLVSLNVNFGTVDCTVHRQLCLQNNIRSYPTTILYNNSKKHQFFGAHTATSLVDFIKDILSPTVMSLTSATFYQYIGQKDSSELWLVDFFAPWCHACQELTPQWRKLAKMIGGIPNVNIGEVNCEDESSLCSDQGVRMYPSIRLYPFGSSGLSTLAVFSGHRTARALYQWLFNFMPSSVEQLDPTTFDELVLLSKDTWLVDFYAPWCGHCVSFAPEFEVLSQWLKGRVRTGKLDCDKHYQFCYKCGVGGYPTVKLYTGVFRSHQGEEIPSQSKDYILSYVNNILDNANKAQNVHDEF